MSEHRDTNQMDRKEINILDYLFILFQARWYIVLNFLIVCVIAAGISLMLPIYFRSTAVLLPPNESDQSFGFSQALQMLPVNIRLGSSGSPTDVYMGIMKSNTVVRAMIEKYDLMHVYGAQTIDDASLSLRGMTSISQTKEGLISISVQDRDPQRAADMANFYWIMLDSLNRQVSQESSAEQVAFVETIMNQNSQALQDAEDALKEFQTRTGVLSPYNQEQVALSLTSEVEADIMQKETILQEYLSRSMSADHPQVKTLVESIRIREEQLRDLQSGARDANGSSIFVPLNQIPDMVIEYDKLSRRVEILSQLEQYLMQQHEQSKIQQANATSTVVVLDRGIVPVKKFRPKRAIIVAIAGAASIFFSIISIVLIEFINRLTELTPGNRDKVKRLSRFLRIQT